MQSCRRNGGQKGTLLLLQFNQESLTGLGTPLENKQQWEPLMNPSELLSGEEEKKKKASHWSTEMTMIYTRSSCPSGAFMPCKDQRRQGLSCHSADIDGVQVEKASGC